MKTFEAATLLRNDTPFSVLITMTNIETEGPTRETKNKSDLLNLKTDNWELRFKILRAVDENIAHIAVESDSDDSVECVELLSRDPRVDWSRRNGSGDTPLMFCIKNNKTEMVEIIGGISGIIEERLHQEETR